MDLSSSFIPVKKAKIETDFSVCLICQKTGQLIGKPTNKSYETLLSFIQERAGYGETDIVSLDFRLTNETVETLQANNASWHRECYDNICHKQKRDRARKRYEKALMLEDHSFLRRSKGRPEKMADVPDLPQELPTPAKLTRSSIEPFDDQLCLFCQTTTAQVLREVKSPNSESRLKQATEHDRNETLRLRLTSDTMPEISATGLKYHDLCWRNNVDRVLANTPKGSKMQYSSGIETRRILIPGKAPKEDNMPIVASDMEFMSLLELLLQEGSVLSMADLHKKYIEIRKANGVAVPDCKRSLLKQKIADHGTDIHFGKPKRKNESEYVYTTKTRDEVIQTAADTSNLYENDMKTVYEASQILRKAISQHISTNKWEFMGSLADTSVTDTYPEYLHHFLRWLLLGPQTGQREGDSTVVFEKEVQSVAQSIMYTYNPSVESPWNQWKKSMESVDKVHGHCPAGVLERKHWTVSTESMENVQGVFPVCPWNFSSMSMELFRGIHGVFPRNPWTFSTVHGDCPGNQWTKSMDNVHGKVPWTMSMEKFHGQCPRKSSMDNVHGICPGTLWTKSMDNVHGIFPWTLSTDI